MNAVLVKNHKSRGLKEGKRMLINDYNFLKRRTLMKSFNFIIV